VEDIVLHDGARTFLQIGANDGYLSDPPNLAIFRHKLTGTFVEPTKLVIYETESMDKADAADLARKLEQAGFAIFEAEQDTIALKRNAETYRRKSAAGSKAA
jgi:hypothetical protein